MILASAAGLVLALVVALVLGRRWLAREALTAWLRRQGVETAAEVQVVGLHDLAGGVRVGDPRRPDFSAARVELALGWNGLTPEVRAIRLVQPVLRARLHDGRLSFGGLQPLIDAWRRRPATPGAPTPDIEVQDAQLQLATDLGELDLAGQASLHAGRLVSLAARADPVRLKDGSRRLELGASSLALRAHGERIAASLDAPIRLAADGATVVENAHAVLSLDAPYPDLVRHRLQGPVAGRLQAVAGGASTPAGSAAGAALTMVFTGGVAGDLAGGHPRLESSGRASATLRAATVRAANGELQLDGIAVTAAGPAGFGAHGLDLDLAAQASGRGGWSGAGTPRAGEAADIAALRRAVRAFTFQAAGVRTRMQGGAPRLSLTAPVSLSSETGARAMLAPRGAGYRLTAEGGGLPRVVGDASQARLSAAGLEAQGRIRVAGLTLGPVQGANLDGAGALRVGRDGASFTGQRCVAASARRLDLGSQSPLRLAGELCPTGRPLIALRGGDWRLDTRLAGVSADVPSLQAKLSQLSGRLDLGQTRGRFVARLAVAGAEATDAAASPRYEPIRLAGALAGDEGVWSGQLEGFDRAGRRLGRARVSQDDRTGRGAVDVDTGELAFAPGGLQPAQLSPLLSLIRSPVAGAARFVGTIAWTRAGASSHGVLQVRDLDFTSPLGKVSGLAGEVQLTSLAPLMSAPGQLLTARQLASPLAPLTALSGSFAVRPRSVEVAQAEASGLGGRLRLSQVQIPLAAGQPVRGVLELDGVELHDLVAASPFGDRVSLQARVSGRIPFELMGSRLRVSGGSLRAIEPGRLSIQRAALTGIHASGQVVAQAPGKGTPAPAAAPQPPANAFTDFAYQAMENLAFSTLTAEVQSRPDGRLGVVFHIVGKHDPPQHQEIRLPLSDLIGRKFMDRTLPLPSGTGVDLTLDTTLNLDELLSDYRSLHGVAGSATVQLGGPKS